MPSAPEPSGLSLNELQRWFLARLIERHQTAHRAPAWVPAPELPPAALIAPSATLSAEQRMNIYIDQYIWRFFEVSGNEQKGLRALLGQADFEALITDYLSRFPPYGFSLNNLCHALPHYMEHYCQRPDKALLSEMVRRLLLLLLRLLELDWEELLLLLELSLKMLPELTLSTTSLSSIRPTSSSRTCPRHCSLRPELNRFLSCRSAAAAAAAAARFLRRRAQNFGFRWDMEHILFLIQLMLPLILAYTPG